MSIFNDIKKDFFLFAGPCVIENEKMLNQTAEELKNITEELDIPFVFKSSYDKANRTSIDSYRGPGLEKGLGMLGCIKKKFDLKIITDVHSAAETEKAAEVADILQIPAFLCRQTDLLLAAGKAGKCVNVKKGQFLPPESIKFVIKKLESAKCNEIFITERGSSFGHGKLVVDFTGIPVIKKFGYPVIFDATHSVQIPPVDDRVTGGKRENIPDLLYAAVGAGVDGIYMEVHPDPDKALCDKGSQFPLSGVKEVLKKAKDIYQVIRR